MNDRDSLESEIAQRVRGSGDYAIAYAILKLAEATQNLAHAVEVVVGTELAGIGASIRDRL